MKRRRSRSERRSQRKGGGELAKLKSKIKPIPPARGRGAGPGSFLRASAGAMVNRASSGLIQLRRRVPAGGAPWAGWLRRWLRRAAPCSAPGRGGPAAASPRGQSGGWRCPREPPRPTGPEPARGCQRTANKGTTFTSPPYPGMGDQAGRRLKDSCICTLNRFNGLSPITTVPTVRSVQVIRVSE